MLGIFKVVCVFLPLLFCLVFCCDLSRDSNPNIGKEALHDGLSLVEEFYEKLFVNNKWKKDDSLFMGDDVSDSDKWKYLRENKYLFITERYYMGKFFEPKDFFLKARKQVSFFNIKDSAGFEKSQMFITLVSTVSTDGKDGVYKQVSFPISFDKTSNKYKIQFLGITVNGILIDPYGEFVRDYELFDKLGFSSHTRKRVLDNQ